MFEEFNLHFFGLVRLPPKSDRLFAVKIGSPNAEKKKTKGPSHRGSIPTFSNPSVLSAFAAAAAVAPSSAVCYFRHATLLVSVRLLSSPPRETSLTSHAVCAEKEGMKTFEVLPPPRLIQSEVKKTLSTLARARSPTAISS